MKKLYAIALAIFISQIIFSQAAPEIEWQNTIGGDSDDALYSIHQTIDGGYILGGQSESEISGDKMEVSLGGADYWVIKLDAAGDIEWQNTIGGNLDDVLVSVQQTPDGGYILGGWSSSDISGDKTENCIGDYDYWVIKLNDEGDIEWQNTIGGNKEDLLHTIIPTSDEGYILGGRSYSDISGDKTEGNLGPGTSDYWAIKLDSLGNIVWQNTVGGNKDDYLRSIIHTLDGGCLLGGYSSSGISGDKAEPRKGDIGFVDFWVLKLDHEGNIVWQNTIGGNLHDYLLSVIQSPDSSYLISGYSNSPISGDKSEDANNYDYWVIRLNSIGNIVWQNTIGGNANDYLQSAILFPDGGYILAGNSNSGSSGDKTVENLGGDDYWIIKLNEAGSIEWQKGIGGSEDDYLYSIALTDDSDFVLGGYSNSDISYDKTEDNLGEFDYWVVKLSHENSPCSTPPTGLNVTHLTSTTAKLHWSADPDAIKYKVQYRKSTVPSWTNTNATTNVKNLFSLQPSTTYKFRIKSLCGPGLTSDWSVVGTFTTSPLKEGEFISDRIEVTIYPNPNNGIFQLELTGIQTEENVSMRMFNLLGEEIYAETISDVDLISQTIKLNATIENGMYFLEIKAGEKIYTEQIIISK